MKKTLALAACLALLTAGAAQAATFSATVDLGGITSVTDDIAMRIQTPYSWFPEYRSVDGGGPFSPVHLTANGTTTLLRSVYCLDMDTSIGFASYPNAAVNDDGIVYGRHLTNANQIAYLLERFAPVTTAGTDMARALQAAVWSLTDTDVANVPGTIWQMSRYSSSYDEYTAILGSLSSYVDTTDYTSHFYWITAPSGDPRRPYQALVALAPPVPIPGTVLLMGSGLAGLVGVARFRRKRSAD
jgi:hypothetical protein